MVAVARAKVVGSIHGDSSCLPITSHHITCVCGRLGPSLYNEAFASFGTTVDFEMQ